MPDDAKIPNDYVTISMLINLLEGIKKREGDLICRCDSMSHSWPPSPTVRERAGKKVLVLNG